MITQSSSNTSQPFVSLLVSTNKDLMLEQFELPDLGLATARYIDQVKLIQPTVSNVINLQSKFTPIEVQSEFTKIEFNSSVNQIDISSNLITLALTNLPTNITQIGV